MNDGNDDDFHFYRDFYNKLSESEKNKFDTMVSVSSDFVDSYIIGLIHKAEYEGMPYTQSHLERLILSQREDCDELLCLDKEKIGKKIYSLYEIGYIYADADGYLRLNEDGKVFVENNQDLYY